MKKHFGSTFFFRFAMVIAFIFLVIAGARIYQMIRTGVTPFRLSEAAVMVMAAIVIVFCGIDDRAAEKKDNLLKDLID